MIRCGINACNGFIERPAPDNTVVNMTLVTCERPRSNSKGSVKSNQPIDARGCGREAPYEDEFLASWIYPRLGGSDCRPLLMAHVMIGLGPDAPELAGVLAGALVEIIEKSGGRAVRRSGSEVIGLWGLTEMTRDEPSLVVAATAEIRAMGAAANIRSVLHAHVVRVPRGAEVMHDVGIALTAAWDEVRTIATMADAIIVTDSFRSACGAIPGLVPLGGAATGPHVPLVYALPDAMAADAIRSLQQSALPSIVDWTANLDGLGDLRPLMLAAAIAGTSFSIDLLARMLDIDPLRLQPALEAACASGLIEAETLQGRRCSFTFRDRELHRTAYDAVPAANRLRLHRKAALAAREASATDGLERPEIVAHHHLLGQDPQQSKRWLGKAARQAIARGESGKAIAYLEQALEQDGGTKNGTNALNRSLLQLLGVQQAVTKGNGSDAVVDAYQRSMALAGETATLAWGQEFRSLWLAQSCHLVKGEVRAALIIGNLLINHLNRRAVHAENAIGRRILVHRMQGLALMLCGRFDQSFAQYDKVLEYYDPAQHAGLRFAYGSDQAALSHAHRAWGYAIMGDSAGSSRMLQIRGPLMVADRYRPATMKNAVWQKDVKIIGEFARALACPTPLFDAASVVYVSAMAEGLDEEDTGSVCRVLERWAGHVRPKAPAKRRRKSASPRRAA